MKFYDYKPAPSPRRVRIFAAEKGIEFERVQVDLAAGEQRGEEFLRINPFGTVPVLELDDGTLIGEVAAICDYLEAAQPDPPMIGVSPATRAIVLMWNARVEQQGLAQLADLYRNTTRGLANHAVPGNVPYEQIPALAERGRLRALDFFDRLDARLDKHEFVAGSHYSMADITAQVAVDFARWSEVDLVDGRPRLAAWFERVSARPSASA